MQVKELRIVYRRRSIPSHPPSRILRSADALHVLWPILERQTVEVFGMLCLDTRADIVGYHEVSRGDVNRTIVHPREVYKAALLANAAAIIVGHNHPSGDPEPSADDMALTSRLDRAGELMGIPLWDHLILGSGGRFYSFQVAGVLARPRWS